MATDIRILIGRRIRRLRMARGLKQVDLAVAMKLDDRQSYVSIIELGKTDMTVSTAQKVADALAVDIGELFNDLASEEDEAKNKNGKRSR